MRRPSRGFVIPGTQDLVLILGILLAAGALLAGAVSWWSNVKDDLRDDGARRERVKWEARETSELQSANAEIVRLNALYRGLEQQNATLVAAAELQRTKEAKNVEATRDRTIADIRAGRIVLRDPGAPAAGQAAGSSGPAQAGAAAAGPAGAKGGELSVESSSFLLGLAADADLVVVDFNACIVTLAADRKVMLDAGLLPASQ